MAKSRNTNVDYLRKLEDRNPAVFARYKAGEFPSIAAALFAGGIRPPPKVLNALKRHWKNAGPADRAEFLKWLGIPAGGAVVPAPTPLPPISVAGPDRRLTPAGKARIRVFYSGAPLESGDLMSEFGFHRLDPSFGTAMHRNSRIKQTMIDALDVWLQAKEAAR